MLSNNYIIIFKINIDTYLAIKSSLKTRWDLMTMDQDFDGADVGQIERWPRTDQEIADSVLRLLGFVGKHRAQLEI